MAAKRKKAPGAEIEEPQFSSFDALASQPPAGRGAAIDGLCALHVRAQSALLQEAFATPDANEAETPLTTPSPKRGSAVSQYGWRAAKSVIGLLIVVVAGVGPLQRLLELSSTEAVVNARLVSLRAPIDGRIEDLVPTIGSAASRG